MPKYNLETAKKYVETHSHEPTTRVDIELQNHEYDYLETAEAIFAALEEKDFSKTVILKNHPDNVEADVYKVHYDGVEWYVKFFVDEKLELHVQIWSLHWWQEGAHPHEKMPLLRTGNSCHRTLRRDGSLGDDPD